MMFPPSEPVDGSEIPNNHLGCIKRCKQWDKLPTSTGAGFLNHPQKNIYTHAHNGTKTYQTCGQFLLAVFLLYLRSVIAFRDDYVTSLGSRSSKWFCFLACNNKIRWNIVTWAVTTTQLDRNCFISHCKDPYEPIRMTHGMSKGFWT